MDKKIDKAMKMAVELYNSYTANPKPVMYQVALEPDLAYAGEMQDYAMPENVSHYQFSKTEIESYITKAGKSMTFDEASNKMQEWNTEDAKLIQHSYKLDAQIAELMMVKEEAMKKASSYVKASVVTKDQVNLTQTMLTDLENKLYKHTPSLEKNYQYMEDLPVHISPSLGSIMQDGAMKILGKNNSSGTFTTKKKPVKKAAETLAPLATRRGESFKDLLVYIEQAQYADINVVMCPSAIMLRKIKWHKGMRKYITATATVPWSKLLDKQQVSTLMPEAMKEVCEKFDKRVEEWDRHIRILEEKELIKQGKIKAKKKTAKSVPKGNYKIHTFDWIDFGKGGIQLDGTFNEPLLKPIKLKKKKTAKKAKNKNPNTLSEALANLAVKNEVPKPDKYTTQNFKMKA